MRAVNDGRAVRADLEAHSTAPLAGDGGGARGATSGDGGDARRQARAPLPFLRARPLRAAGPRRRQSAPRRMTCLLVCTALGYSPRCTHIGIPRAPTTGCTVAGLTTRGGWSAARGLFEVAGFLRGCSWSSGLQSSLASRCYRRYTRYALSRQCRAASSLPPVPFAVSALSLPQEPQTLRRSNRPSFKNSSGEASFRRPPTSPPLTRSSRQSARRRSQPTSASTRRRRRCTSARCADRCFATSSVVGTNRSFSSAAARQRWATRGRRVGQLLTQQTIDANIAGIWRCSSASSPLATA